MPIQVLRESAAKRPGVCVCVSHPVPRVAYPVQRIGISVDEWSDQPLVLAILKLLPML